MIIFSQLVLLFFFISCDGFSQMVSLHLVLHAEHLHGLPQLLLLLWTELLLCNLASSSVLFRTFSPFPWEFFVILTCLFFISFFFLWPLFSFPWELFCQICGNKRSGPFFPFFPPWLLPSTTSPPFPFSSTWSFSAISNTLWKILVIHQDRFSLINGYLGHRLVFLSHIYHSLLVFGNFRRIDSIWISRTWLSPIMGYSLIISEKVSFFWSSHIIWHQILLLAYMDTGKIESES